VITNMQTLTVAMTATDTSITVSSHSPIPPTFIQIDDEVMLALSVSGAVITVQRTPLGVSPLVQDNFLRPDAVLTGSALVGWVGFGHGEVGGDWYINAPSSARVALTSNQAVISLNQASGAHQSSITQPTAMASDVDVWTIFSWDTLPTTSYQSFTLQLRFDAGQGQGDYIQFNTNPDGSCAILAATNGDGSDGNTGTQIGATTTLAAGTITAGTNYGVRIQLTGSSTVEYRARLWAADTTAEPSTWDLDVTGTPPTAQARAGALGIGVSTIPAFTGTAPICRISRYYAQNYSVSVAHAIGAGVNPWRPPLQLSGAFGLLNPGEIVIANGGGVPIGVRSQQRGAVLAVDDSGLPSFGNSRGLLMPQLAAAPVDPAPTAGQLYYDTTRTALRVYNGASWSQSAASVVKYNAADVVANAADTYLSDSALAAASVFRVGTVFRWRLVMTKTAAGVAAPVWIVRVGTAGTTADTAWLTFTGVSLQTAVVDTGEVLIEAILRVGGATGILAGFRVLRHNLAATGFASVATEMQQATSGSINFNTANLIVGVSVNPGAAGVWTHQLVYAEALNL
jgi:hypothetical protein